MTAVRSCEYWKKHPLKRKWKVTPRQREIQTILECQTEWLSTSEVTALMFPEVHKTGANYCAVRLGLIGLLRRELITCKSVIMPKQNESPQHGPWKPVVKNKRTITLWKVKRN